MTSVPKTGSVTRVPFVKNPFKIWVLAGRPNSLVAATMPVISALALAWKDIPSLQSAGWEGRFMAIPAVCCVFFAMLAQLAANLINDFSDYRTGANVEIRASRESKSVTQKSLAFGAVCALSLAILFGLATVPYGGAPIILVGLFLCLICLIYSLGPFPLSEVAFGDLAVIATFGLSAVVFTYYLQTGSFSLQALLLGLAFGMVVNNVLIANNYADHDEDKSVNKYTTIVFFGRKFGRLLYLFEGFVCIGSLATIYTLRECWGLFAVLSIAIYFVTHLNAYRTLCRPDYYKRRGLDQAGINVVLLGVLVPLAILF